jgi:tetratricopeptide (TPR) repeat protein
VDLIIALAALREAQGELDMAEDLLRQAIECEPNNAESYFRLGVVLDKEGKRPEGLKLMRKAIELNDRHARALNYVGYTMAEEGKNLDEAERLIRRALAVEPFSGYILDSLGWIYYQRGDFGLAFNYLKRAASSGDEDPVIFEHLGDAAMKMEKYGVARKAYEKALKLKHPKAKEIRAKLRKASAQPSKPLPPAPPAPQAPSTNPAPSSSPAPPDASPAAPASKAPNAKPAPAAPPASPSVPAAPEKP